jgi:hypothetical protein
MEAASTAKNEASFMLEDRTPTAQLAILIRFSIHAIPFMRLHIWECCGGGQCDLPTAEFCMDFELLQWKYRIKPRLLSLWLNGLPLSL